MHISPLMPLGGALRGTLPNPDLSANGILQDQVFGRRGSTSSSSVGGSNTQVQYNNSGVLAGSANLTFDGSSLTIGTSAIVPKITGSTSASGNLTLQATSNSTDGEIVFLSDTNTETARMTSSNRMVIGNTSSIAIGSQTQRFQVIGSDFTDASFGLINFDSDILGVGPVCHLAYSRNNTIGSHTIVANGDRCGIIAGDGSDGSVFAGIGNVEFTVDGTPGAGDMPGSIRFWTTIDGASSPISPRWKMGQDGIFSWETDRGLRANNQTSAAAAQLGTLTNAPAAGNPGYWLKINIGGTNYAIPCWAG